LENFWHKRTFTMHTTALKKKEVHALLTECMDFLVIYKVFVLV
jgi:hypothetical protein